ncbi:MAG: lipopolysaccharide transport periplasmic protein LptA [Lysobacteraceae bacterium]
MSLFAADSTPARCARLPLVALLAAAAFAAAPALARESDRNQPMEIGSNHAEGTLEDTGITVLTGNVVITQGTLDIRAARADIHRSGGEVSRAVLSGSQAMLKQQMDDGSLMTAKADRIDYNMTSDVIVLTGNYTVTTPRGSTSGQRLTYDLKNGRVESGGEAGGRVKMTIQPKSARTPVAPGKP